MARRAGLLSSHAVVHCSEPAWRDRNLLSHEWWEHVTSMTGNLQSSSSPVSPYFCCHCSLEPVSRGVFKSSFSYDHDLGDHFALSLPLSGRHPSNLELVEDNRISPSVPSPVCSPTPIAARGFCPSAREERIWSVIWCVLSRNWSGECSWQDLLKVS